MPLENLSLVSLPFLASIARVIPTHLLFLNILVISISACTFIECMLIIDEASVWLDLAMPNDEGNTNISLFKDILMVN